MIVGSIDGRGESSRPAPVPFILSPSWVFGLGCGGNRDDASDFGAGWARGLYLHAWCWFWCCFRDVPAGMVFDAQGVGEQFEGAECALRLSSAAQ